jgi:hypothetical protein
MNDELEKLWIKRADAEAPAGFADRVMEAIRREPPPSSKGAVVVPPWSRALRVAVCVLACLACLYRMSAVVDVFFVQ